MKRTLLYIVWITVAALSVRADPTPFSIRLNYMLKQIGDSSVSPGERLVWADSVLANKHLVEDRKVVADVLHKKAEIAYDAAYYRKSLDSYLRWINDYGGGISTDSRLKAYDKIAELYYYIGWYELAIRLSLDIIKSDKSSGLDYLDIKSYQRIAHCYIRLHDLKLAEKYAEISDSCINVTDIHNIGTRDKVIFDMQILKAAISMIESDFKKTYTHLGEARKYARSVRDTIAILGDEAIVYEAIGDNKIARQCFESIMKYHDVSYQKMVCINNYVYFLTGQKDYAKAHEICAVSYNLLDAMELDHAKSNLLDLESDIFMYEKDYQNAYLTLKESKEIKDTIFSPEHMRYIYGANHISDQYSLSTKLEREEKKSKILKIGGIILLLIASCVIIMWLLNSTRLKKLRKDSEAETSGLRDEISRQDKLITDLNDSIGRKNTEIEKYIANLGDEEAILDNFNNLHCKLSANISHDHPDLSKAELNIATYILMGISTKDIAERQHLSTRTIENTKYRLYKKLGVTAADVPDYLRSYL